MQCISSVTIDPAQVFLPIDFARKLGMDLWDPQSQVQFLHQFIKTCILARIFALSVKFPITSAGRESCWWQRWWVKVWRLKKIFVKTGFHRQKVCQGGRVKWSLNVKPSCLVSHEQRVRRASKKEAEAFPGPGKVHWGEVDEGKADLTVRGWHVPIHIMPWQQPLFFRTNPLFPLLCSCFLQLDLPTWPIYLTYLPDPLTT